MTSIGNLPILVIGIIERNRSNGNYNIRSLIIYPSHYIRQYKPFLALHAVYTGGYVMDENN